MKREAEDEFLILACDGIWDVLSNEQCVEFVRDKVRGVAPALACARVQPVAPDLASPPAHPCNHSPAQLRRYNKVEKVCEALLDECLTRGSRDNMSAVLILFPGAPEPDPKLVEEQARKDEEDKKRKDGGR